GGAVIKLAGIETGLKEGIFRGKARVFNSEAALVETLMQTPEVFQDNDMVVIRYAGPKGAPGMPELLDPTSRITTLCREKNITIALMTDARFSGGSVGLVIGHVGPEAYLGGPIALIEDNDTIVVDIKKDSIDCVELEDKETYDLRMQQWKQAVKENHGIHPYAAHITNRLLKRMRATAKPALDGGGMN
ncbi:MAG TPA: dihydroxy-acid dehydratase, partial [Candidatus Saccharimonadales bacterium]|nr:dihydroxy-acid dehydratase [Candidatus Saccharimonadales bacterium]